MNSEGWGGKSASYESTSNIKAGPVGSNLSGPPQKDKPRDQKLKLGALMPNTVLPSMFPALHALSVVQQVNCKTENSV